jgi:hypothetical protein
MVTRFVVLPEMKLIGVDFYNVCESDITAKRLTHAFKTAAYLSECVCVLFILASVYIETECSAIESIPV